MREKLLNVFGGVTVFFFLFVLFGGLYTITPPNGPVDTAYKMNRLTGKVWLIKTYSKQVGAVRVLAARQAEVEKTKELKESDLPDVVAMQQEPLPRERQR
jgi:hypothetical protein